MQKKKIKWLAVMMVVLLICANLPVSTSNMTMVYAETEILGDFEILDGVVLVKYHGSGGDIAIPEGVTIIGYGVFAGCDKLKSIKIPEGVISIAEDAFWYCSELTSIYIPKSVAFIGNRAFGCCGNLEKIIVDENNLKYDSRDSCNAIIETETNTLLRGCENTGIPEGVKSIGDYAFSECSNLTNIRMPEGVKSIGRGAFSNCKSLKNITIPDSVIDIGAYAFNGCNLESIEIPEGVTSIEEAAFSGCNSLTSIGLPESVTDIRDFAFCGCSSLESIKLPKKLTSIGEFAFGGCSSLKSIELPKSVVSIGDSAFQYCRCLTSLEIPESVTSIGQYAFGDCGNLENIIVDENNALYDSREHCNAIIETKTNTLLRGCKITFIPEEITGIGKGAFSECTGLIDIKIPENVTFIGERAFEGCVNLESIEIPEDITFIGDGAFKTCVELTSITVDENNLSYDSRENCNAIIETDTNTLIRGCKNTIIPEGVLKIGQSAFDNCRGLINIKIPESVTNIANSAFWYCRNLIRITIPKGVASIGNQVFDGCIGLTFYVEKGSYGEEYAKSNSYKYKTFLVFDASKNPVLEKEVMDSLLGKNAENDVIIKTDNGITFAFEKGKMEVVEGIESYDFSTTVIRDYGEAELSSIVSEKDFVAKIIYNYSDSLLGEAEIKIFIGKEYAGKKICYSLLKEDNTLDEKQNVEVDFEGYITVKQSYGSVYVLTLASVLLGDVNNDGAIDSKDALAILKDSVGIEQSVFVKEAADVNKDGDIDSKDALMVLKHSVGILQIS